MSTAPKALLSVAAVVVTYRRPRLATEVVRRLVEEEQLPPDRIVLVVNGEGGLDDAALQAAVHVVHLPHNVGPAGGFYEGVMAASALPDVDWLYLCEDDVFLFDLPSPRLAGLVESAVQLDRGTDSPLGAIVAYGRDLHRLSGHTTNHEVDSDVGYDAVDAASWGASLVSCRAIRSGVLPDPAYFFGYEDFDFWYQMKRAGFRVLLDRASAFAVASQMSLRGRDEALQDHRPMDAAEPWRAFYVSRNYFRLARRHGSPTWVAAHLGYSVRRFQLASSRAERSAILRGLVAGARGRGGKDERFERTQGETDGPNSSTGGGPPNEPRLQTRRRRRILHVLPCDTARGAQVFANNLCSLLDDDENEHLVLTLFRSAPAVLRLTVELDVPMGPLRSIGLDPRVLPRLRHALRDIRPDVIVAHGGEPLKYLAALDRGDARLVYFAIGTASKKALSGLRRNLYSWLLSRADLVVGVSAETIEEATSVFHIPKRRTAIVENGRDPQVFRPREEDGEGKDGPIRLVFVGHLTATKRPLSFVAAIDELCRRGCDVSGVIAGDGPLEEEVRRVAARSPAIEVLGRQNDVATVLRGADVFVFTSVPEGEGMPGVLIEAAMVGLPVVTTAVPGASTLVAHGVTGFVVPVDDDEALVVALEKLVGDDRLRLEMGRVARERAVANFSLERAARSWREIFDSVAPQHLVPLASGRAASFPQRHRHELQMTRQDPATVELDRDEGRGTFVVSLDFELQWGLRHRGTPNAAGSAALMGARAAVPRLLDLFGQYELAATWATVGFLFAGSRSELEEFSPSSRPAYRRVELDPYQELVGDDEESDPFHFASSLVAQIARTPRQEIGSHTFSHYLCLETGQDGAAFRADLDSACRIAQAYGVRLRSIVFPANQVNPLYLPMLKDAGFIAYRGAQPGLMHRPSQRSGHSLLRRAARTADCYLPLQRSQLFSWGELVDEGGLCNVPASRFLRPYSPSLSALEPLRLHRVVAALEDAATSGRIFHLWWHPHNFGLNIEENLRFLTRVLEAFEKLKDGYGMRSMTLSEVAEHALTKTV